MTTTPKTGADNTEAIIDLVERTREPFTIAGIPAAIVPDKTELQLFNELMPAPKRIREIVEMHTPGSFIDYLNKFSTGASTVFCDMRRGKFIAVIDYHADQSNPAWCTHSVSYTCPTTPEWDKWKANNGTWKTQEAFALFIEENQEEIITPAGAKMLEIALSLQTKTNVDFNRAIRLDNGEIQLTYKERIEGAAGATGQLHIPSTIKIGLQLFEGGKGYEMEARFRYRVKDGNLAMKYDLIRPHKAHEAAIEATYQLMHDSMTAGNLYRGSMD